MGGGRFAPIAEAVLLFNRVVDSLKFAHWLEIRSLNETGYTCARNVHLALSLSLLMAQATFICHDLLLPSIKLLLSDHPVRSAMARWGRNAQFPSQNFAPAFRDNLPYLPESE